MQISNMSNIEVLKELKDRGLLKGMVTSGIMPVKVLSHIDMYYHVDAQVQSGSKRSIAIKHTAQSFNVTPRLVQRVLKCY